MVIAKKDIFSSIQQAHLACGHGGERRTSHEIIKGRKIANITNNHIKTFISLCQICQKKRNFNNRYNKRCNKSIISSKFGERGQVDLIDISMNPSEEGYKYILNYQDHLTKFVFLRPLKSKCANAVNKELIDIFTVIGAPDIIQCDNGNEFATIQKCVLDKYWPKCKLITSRPRHPQSQGSVERANGDVMNMLRCWIHQNTTIDWGEGLKFIQYQKNNSYHRSLKCTPYKATLGRDPPNCNFVFNDDDGNDDDDDDDDNDPSPSRENVSPFESPSHYYERSETPILDNNFNISSNINDITVDSQSNFQEIVSISSKSFNSDIEHHNTRNCSSFSKGNNSHIDKTMHNMLIEENIHNISTIRSEIVNNNAQKEQEEKTDNVVIDIGTPIIVKVPKIDCPKLSFPNVIGIINKYMVEIDKYEIKTNHGIIDTYFSKHDFQLCVNLSVYIAPDDNNERVSLRSLVKLDCSKFVGCKCYGVCQNNICFCYKLKKKCGNYCKHRKNDRCLNRNPYKEYAKRKR